MKFGDYITKFISEFMFAARVIWKLADELVNVFLVKLTLGLQHL